MKRKIAIDCRFLNMSGIGRYLEGILENLDFEAHDYTLVGKKECLDALTSLGGFEPVYCETSPFSRKGMTKFPAKAINHCAFFFTPNFLVPYGITCKIYSTIHDVVFLDIKDCNNGWLDYKIKKHFLKRALKRSQKVFTVSNFSKKRITHYFPKFKDKILISGTSVAQAFIDYNQSPQKENYIVYVGNIKKHKGLGILLDAHEKSKAETGYQLYIIGSAENFITSDQTIAQKLKESEAVFLSQISQQELLSYIAKAKLLIQPSLYEGFGLPPLEALYLGTKPILSDIEVFREVYAEMDVVFFESGNASALADAILHADCTVSTTKQDILKRYNFKDIAHGILQAMIGE